MEVVDGTRCVLWLDFLACNQGLPLVQSARPLLLLPTNMHSCGLLSRMIRHCLLGASPALIIQQTPVRDHQGALKNR
jgi:hypothetical protein